LWVNFKLLFANKLIIKFPVFFLVLPLEGRLKPYKAKCLMGRNEEQRTESKGKIKSEFNIN
jgi:hypothetical protein